MEPVPPLLLARLCSLYLLPEVERPPMFGEGDLPSLWELELLNIKC